MDNPGYKLLMQVVLIICCLMLLATCNLTTTAGKQGNFGVRVSLESSFSGPLHAAVWVEGPNGMILTGSLVIMLTPDDERLILNYDNSQGMYRSTLAVPRTGDYTVIVRSITAESEYTLVVPHASLSDRPSVQVLRDSAGNSAMTGSELDSSSTIDFAWKTVTNADRYQLRISQSGSVIYIGNTEDSLYSIDAGILDAGVFQVQIIAQSVVGNAFFDEVNYSSISESRSPALVFELTDQ